MVLVVVLISLLLVHTGLPAPAEPNCSAALECYTKLRKEFQTQILLELDPAGGDSFANYQRYCGVLFRPVSPCGTQDSFKNCSTHPDIEKRERVYKQLRGFACGGDDKDWKRLLAILRAPVSDPCKGAIQAVQSVLRNDTSKCGSVRQLFGECASQQHLPTDVLEPGMELLGCKDLQPKLTTSPSPGTQPYPQVDCKVAAVRYCLEMQERHLEIGLGLDGEFPMSEEESCWAQNTCLDQHLLEGCAFSETHELTLRQATIDAVRKAACENNRTVLKGIRSAVSCFNAVAFRECLAKSDIKLGNVPNCNSVFKKTNKCVAQSSKPCFPADQVKNANKLVAAYLGTYGCAPSTSGPHAQNPDQKKGKGNGSSLVSTSAVALSVGLAAAFALRH